MSSHDFKGPKIAFRGDLAVDSGSLWGRLGLTLGGSWGDFGESGGGRGGSPAAEKEKVHFLKFKIMKLCGGFSLLLKRLEINLNHFFDDIL